MKLTRNELKEIFAEISAEEVIRYTEAIEASPIEELGIITLLAKILDRIDKKLFK